MWCILCLYVEITSTSVERHLGRWTDAAVDVLDVSLVLCLPMRIYVMVGWCFLVGELLRDCLLQRHGMEITVGILRFRQ